VTSSLSPRGTETTLNETYPDGWLHATIHLNPETGEIHSDGDHRIRFWLLAHLKKPWRIGNPWRRGRRGC
jgi:hypothetical protein